MTRYVSPRQRALRTLKLLGLDSDIRNIEVTETIREWDYGEFEGLTDKQIEERRDTAGINGDWSIWEEGCPGGEYVAHLHGASCAWGIVADGCMNE